MKKAGIIMLITGILLFMISALDLFIEKNYPLELTVTGFIAGIISAFAGPAVMVFPLEKQLRKKN
ncbi:MAG: hypothetical protein ACT4ON_01680 [Bacteroidota bacterium]